MPFTASIAPRRDASRMHVRQSMTPRLAHVTACWLLYEHPPAVPVGAHARVLWIVAVQMPPAWHVPPAGEVQAVSVKA